MRWDKSEFNNFNNCTVTTVFCNMIFDVNVFQHFSLEQMMDLRVVYIYKNKNCVFFLVFLMSFQYVFILDTSSSMNLTLSNGLSYLDCAKAAIEKFFMVNYSSFRLIRLIYYIK